MITVLFTLILNQRLSEWKTVWQKSALHYRVNLYKLIKSAFDLSRCEIDEHFLFMRYKVFVAFFQFFEFSKILPDLNSRPWWQQKPPVKNPGKLIQNWVFWETLPDRFQISWKIFPNLIGGSKSVRKWTCIVICMGAETWRCVAVKMQNCSKIKSSDLSKTIKVFKKSHLNYLVYTLLYIQMK